MNQLVTEARALCRALEEARKPCGIAAMKQYLVTRENVENSFHALVPRMAAKIERLEAERDRFKARAEAAEADMKRIADDMDGETDACYPCSICAKNNRECDTSDNCFKWRGPQEGANP